MLIIFARYHRHKYYESDNLLQVISITIFDIITPSYDSFMASKITFNKQ
jgi:hypothetical protein